MNTEEKHIFKYVQDCSGGRGDKFLPRIVLIGIEIISGRYFVFCSCFQGAALAALSTDRMDGLCFALSSLPDLGVLLLGLRGNPSDRACEPTWSCQAAWGGWDQYFPEWSSLEVVSEIQTCEASGVETIRRSIIRKYLCTSQGHELLVPSSSCHRNATRGSYVVITPFQQPVQKLKTSKDAAAVFSSQILFSLCISGADVICSCSSDSFSPNFLLDLSEY